MAPRDHNRNHVIRVMVVGDSISHGREGDFTWRHRLWEWFRRENIPVDFVGPYQGTVPAEEPRAPAPPPLADEPSRDGIFRADGGYAAAAAPGFLANSAHFAAAGRQLAQAKRLIAEQVKTYRPDLCLVQLGFNDLAWGFSGPAEALTNMEGFISEARAVKPDMRFAVADVPQRTAILGREDLPTSTEIYNGMLARAAARWSTPASPIALVKFCENYSCCPSCSPAAYDGLHPNSLGEYQLAQAFTRTLVSALGIGHRELTIPSHIPIRPLHPPTGLEAEATPGGITVLWDPVYGAYEYEVRIRLKGQNWPVTPSRVSSNRHDTRYCFAGQVWEYQVRALCGDSQEGGLRSPWSAVVSAMANPKTLDGPRAIVTRATAKGFEVSWEPVEGDVDRYGLIYYDEDLPGSFPTVVGAKGTGGLVTELVPGHLYRVGVETWTRDGGGCPTWGTPVVAGGMGLVAPTRVTVIDGHAGPELVWKGSEGAAGYHIYARRKDVYEFGAGTEQPYHTVLGKVMVGRIDLAMTTQSAAWDCEFAVRAFNGNVESELSQWVTPPAYGWMAGDYTGGPMLGEEDSISIRLAN